MTIKMKYDPAVDRMRLAVHPEGGEMRVFWVRRNQFLAWLARLSDVVRELGVEPKEIEPLKAPQHRPPRDPAIDDAVPEMLDALRVRVEGDTAQLMMVQGVRALCLKLKAPGVNRLQEMLATRAERAGWDPSAGIQRLRAMTMARVAITRSKEGGTQS